MSVTGIYLVLVIVSSIVNPEVVIASGDTKNHVEVEDCICQDQSTGWYFDCAPNASQMCNEVAPNVWMPTCSNCYKSSERLCDPDFLCGGPPL